MTMDNATATLDASGLACPMPVVKTKMAINKLESGQTLKVISTDRGSLSDIPAWAEATGNRLLEQAEQDGTYLFLLQKA
jgi:tRNA 2-thiouridine synthesizing protein A